jgi:hypothetical protein
LSTAYSKKRTQPTSDEKVVNPYIKRKGDTQGPKSHNGIYNWRYAENERRGNRGRRKWTKDANGTTYVLTMAFGTVHDHAFVNSIQMEGLGWKRKR